MSAPCKFILRLYVTIRGEIVTIMLIYSHLAIHNVPESSKRLTLRIHLKREIVVIIIAIFFTLFL